MIVHEHLEQGAEDWLQIRKGRATASQADLILTPTGKPSVSRIKYMRKLARECACDDPLEWFGNKYTDWGHNHEDEARELFEDTTGLMVQTVGFCTRPDGIIGFSPDGLIMDSDGKWNQGLEIKCPSPDKHVEYLMEGKMPDEYKIQVHWSLAASGLSAWWFMSYFPGLNPFIIKVEADEFTEKVKEAQDQFLIEYAVEREKVLDEILPSRNKSDI
jgi:putative phage-type endonuclease